MRTYVYDRRLPLQHIEEVSRALHDALAVERRLIGSLRRGRELRERFDERLKTFRGRLRRERADNVGNNRNACERGRGVQAVGREECGESKRGQQPARTRA